MKISAFVCIINPEFWCFPYQEALRSYCDLADEIIMVDGGSIDGSLNKIKKISDKIKIIHLNWPWDYKQREFPLHLNYGLDNCNGDWVIKFDIDFVLHDFDAIAFKRKLQDVNHDANIWVASFTRYNLLNRFQAFEKDSLNWVIHKKFTDNKIRFGVGIRQQHPDWSQAVIVQKIINGVPYGDTYMEETAKINLPAEHVLKMGNPVYNYDCFFRTKEKCQTWFARAAKAYREETGYPLYGKDDEDSWKLWRAIRQQQKKYYEKIDLKIEDHPIYIQDKIKNMTPDMWGYNNWDWKL